MRLALVLLRLAARLLRYSAARARDGFAVVGVLGVVGLLLLPPAERARSLRWAVGQVRTLVYSAPPPPPLEGAPTVVWPVDQATVTSRFGHRVHPILGRTKMHLGVDLAVPEGTDVHAATAGKVTRARYDRINGHHVVIEGEGLRTAYCHLASITVEPGQTVRPGQLVGLSGQTGRATGPHLHFGAWWHGTAVDPLRLPRS